MNKFFLLVGFLLLNSSHCQQKSRELKTATFTGTGYELGFQHGQHFKKEIANILEKWDDNLANFLSNEGINKSTGEVVNAFFEYARFTPAIKQWTPELYEEIQGIADGSDQSFDRIMALNLIDEFWNYLFNPTYHHCSSLGVPAGNGSPAFVAQNMDVENYMDGFQTLMRIKATDKAPAQLILTVPGLVALNGMNEKGVGVCVNSLLQLQPNPEGLPVAFVVRKLLTYFDKKDILNFITSVNHASGQNYVIGIRDEVFDFEASANKVIRYNPNNENGSLYHTNHPIVNDDLNLSLEWAEKYDPNLPENDKPTSSNSYVRLEALKNRMISSNLNDEVIKTSLRSKDDPENPVCNELDQNEFSFSFASTIMTLSGDPHLQITTGPPSESKYLRVEFDGE